MHDMLRGAERLVPRFSDRDRYTTGTFYVAAINLGSTPLKLSVG